MNPNQIAKRLEEYEALCRRMGVPRMVEGRVILETVLARDDQPTSDQIMELVKVRVPRVSRTTVCRVLNSLVDMGVIRRLHRPGPAARFDGQMLHHHHLICQQCGTVIDVEDTSLDHLSLAKRKLHGFKIEDFSVQFSGTCRECQEKAN